MSLKKLINISMASTSNSVKLAFSASVSKDTGVIREVVTPDLSYFKKK